MVLNALEFVDFFAIFYFLFIWFGYGRFAEWRRNNSKCINQVMEQYRYAWFKTILKREQRMIDTGVMAGLQNGTSFFASCALFAIGGTISLLSDPSGIHAIVESIPYSQPGTVTLWSLKIIGLTMIFVYAFFKLAWAYRLFNYSAIMIGASPTREERDTEIAKDITDKGARLNIIASRHFNRGIRAFFFALGYLGWFIHPLLFMGITTFVAFVLYRRIFHSEAFNALI